MVLSISKYLPTLRKNSDYSEKSLTYRRGERVPKDTHLPQYRHVNAKHRNY